VLANMRPVDEREFSRLLAEATAATEPIALVGGGSKDGIGRPMNAATTVSTKGLRGITLYESSEMVMSARAGTPLAQIEDALASRRQMLAFEPIELAAIGGGETGEGTIAGVFATNISGARRIRVGAARDHLLGVRAVSGRGEVFKSGGRVMKNVTGLDLCRGLAGSWGTLAVMCEVTFKVQPMPEETGTLILLGLPDEIAVEVLCEAMRTPYEVSGAVHLQRALVARLWHEGLRRQGQAVTALRLENFAKSVAYRKGRLKEHLKAYGEIHDLDAENSLAFWRELRQLSVLQGSDAQLWRISTTPGAGPKVVAAVSAYMECRAFYDWSGGLVWAEVLPTTDAGAADIRRVIATHGGHATLIRAEPQVRSAVEVFQPLEAGLHKLSRKLKAAFDPAGILNPGRMYASF
jgi:glycolate oxidase FAD binding subunit